MSKFQFTCSHCQTTASVPLPTILGPDGQLPAPTIPMHWHAVTRAHLRENIHGQQEIAQTVCVLCDECGLHLSHYTEPQEPAPSTPTEGFQIETRSPYSELAQRPGRFSVQIGHQVFAIPKVARPGEKVTLVVHELVDAYEQPRLFKLENPDG
jgi:hypothetical protein